ncbi:MAG: hypothetical protein IJ911_11355 [Salinivirgaceae bacterium]|nr:hypothetical protein [Salinivirgaceae bacterium]
MNRTALLIVLIISLFGATVSNAQNLDFRKSYVSSSTVKKVQARINQRTKLDELRFLLSKSTENGESGHQKVTQVKDSSYIRLLSGTQWFLCEKPQKPRFFRFRVLINSKNESVANYYNFVAFCRYYEKNGDLNYDGIDYISMDKEFVSDTGERFSMNYKICFSSDGSPLIY